MHFSINILRVIESRRIILVGYVARVGEMRNAYKTFVGKPVVKRLRGRRRHRWDDNIRMELK
jgi:hypothetical protein